MSLDYPGELKVITRFLRRNNQKSHRQIGNATLKALKRKRVAMSQGMQVTSTAVKGKWMDSFLEPLEGMQPADTSF